MTRAIPLRVLASSLAWLALAAPVQAQAAKKKPATPAPAPAAKPEPKKDEPKKADARVDLNTATVGRLRALPGVGPVIAQEIISARPFKSVDDLKHVRGVNARLYADLADRVRVGDVPARKDMAKDSAKKDAPSPSGKKVDLNTATVQELEALPEIGPVRAAAIVKARPFRAIEDLMKIEGIKQGVFDQIKDRVTVR